MSGKQSYVYIIMSNAMPWYYSWINNMAMANKPFHIETNFYTKIIMGYKN